MYLASASPSTSEYCAISVLVLPIFTPAPKPRPRPRLLTPSMCCSCDSRRMLVLPQSKALSTRGTEFRNFAPAVPPPGRNLDFAPGGTVEVVAPLHHPPAGEPGRAVE